ncbi:unnamed protein product [Rotaria magnacalcarata]|uniref:MYND-type domain-containing protein n=1 Tax=Rotaria magnacalcarata TaxID=392030 RepID=A0A816CXF5_9BILA|nr:unnamed protein product [Rotaria magnacalcarata]CAF2027715.1 unnamed protein product [Rotaria magnacalcarata]CAF3936827.1 unnamed protein product [Rotaria magnacalcarata]CAF3981744.1 unnamed protein product [Rotaria magnacalcarata]
MSGDDANDDRTLVAIVNDLPSTMNQFVGFTSKEESDLILHIRRTVLHSDEDSTNDAITAPTSTLSFAILDFKVERAKQKYAAESFEEAFYECWKIPQEQRPLEIWKIGGECCKKLRVFAVAQRWFSEAIHVCRSNNSDLNVKLEQARIARFFNNYLTQYPMIDIRVDQRGKGIYSKRVISPGEDIFTDIPLVHAQTVDTLSISPACATCTTSLLTPAVYFETTWSRMPEKLQRQIEEHWPPITLVPCSFCPFELYCSETCRQQAWDSYHKILCPSANPETMELFQFCASRQIIVRGTWNSIFSPMILAKLIAMIILHVVNSVHNGTSSNGVDLTYAHQFQRTDDGPLEQAKEIFSEFISSGDPTYVRTIPRMLKLMNNIFNHPSMPIQYDLNELEFSYRFYQIACNAQSFSSPTYAATLYTRFLSNVRQRDRTGLYVTLQTYLKGEPADQVFGGLFPLQSSLNHSCDNSCEIMDCQVTPEVAGIKVRCKHQLKPGDELTINYVDLALGRRARRAMLKRAYNFWCECQRCAFEGDDAYSCTECKLLSPSIDNPNPNLTNGNIPYRKPFPACSRCRNAWYCSPNCQKQAWKRGHKLICKDWTKERSSSSAN